MLVREERRIAALARAVIDGCARAEEFPGLRAKSYDSLAHHFHSPGSPGALFVNCHMPARKHMVIDARRDHAIRIPRPDLTVNIGTPNTCSGLHASWPPN